MARAVKKVKTNKKLGKKFYIILFSIIGVLAIAGIITGVVLALKDDNEELYDYFQDYKDIKINYDEVSDIVTKGEVEHIFIFMYDGSTFNAKTSEDDDDYSLEDEALVNNVIVMYNKVKEINAKQSSDIVSFYIINTNLSGNSAALNDTTYLGGFASTPALAYIAGESFSEKAKDQEIVVTGYSSAKLNGSIFKEAIKYISRIDLLV